MRLFCHAALWCLCLFLLACPARADESGCRAVVTLVRGGSRHITEVAGRVGQGEMTTTVLVVTMDGGDELLAISRLQKLDRMAATKHDQDNNLERFAFRDRKGHKGQFLIDGDFMLVGQTADGPWAGAFNNIKSVSLVCP